MNVLGRRPAWMAALALAVALAACSGVATEQAGGPERTLAPADVVRLQLEALARNGIEPADAGIRTAYRFASPANRRAIGPVEAFIRLVRNPGYRALVDHRHARLGETIYRGDRAALAVTVTALDRREARYVFFLSRQDTATCRGCWITDAVLPAPGSRPSLAPRVEA